MSRLLRGEAVTTRCSYCNKLKRPPKVKNHPANAHWRSNPFCSTECAKADYARKSKA